jgi:hypothetical protein
MAGKVMAHLFASEPLLVVAARFLHRLSEPAHVQVQAGETDSAMGDAPTEHHIPIVGFHSDPGATEVETVNCRSVAARKS